MYLAFSLLNGEASRPREALSSLRWCTLPSHYCLQVWLPVHVRLCLHFYGCVLLAAIDAVPTGNWKKVLLVCVRLADQSTATLIAAHHHLPRPTHTTFIAINWKLINELSLLYDFNSIFYNFVIYFLCNNE